MIDYDTEERPNRPVRIPNRTLLSEEEALEMAEEIIEEVGRGQTFDAYQDAASLTRVYPTGKSADERLPEIGVLYTALGLNGETGEVAEKVKKYIREDDEKYLRQMRDEMGDVLWYWTMLCTELDLDAGTVAQANTEKLLDRMERGQITGEGDER